MNDDVLCPLCDHEFDTDDFYNNNLFEEGEHGVKCPICRHEFKVEVWAIFRYEIKEES